jgi:prepilin-type N-terminal cleavage/methylation domain-containing protein/prepilin-type processing-associated H-X9-DG protein
MRRKGFSLMELMVVVSLFTILAAILFPILAQATEKGRQSQCLSNVRQIGQALLTYAQDYDETLPPSRQATGSSWPCIGTMIPGSQWNKVILPYVKSEAIFSCPSDPTRGRSPFRPRSYDAVAGPPTLRWGCAYLNGLMGQGWGARLAEIAAPTSMALAYERIDGATVEDVTSVHASLAEDWCAVGPLGVAYPRKSQWFTHGGPAHDGPHGGGGNVVCCDGHARWFKYGQTKVGGDEECLTPASASLFDRRYPL